ncbi:hypothetical protein CapIbe_012374 [Capra ibex]
MLLRPTWAVSSPRSASSIGTNRPEQDKSQNLPTDADIETESPEPRKHSSHVMKPGFKSTNVDIQPRFVQADSRDTIPDFDKILFGSIHYLIYFQGESRNDFVFTEANQKVTFIPLHKAIAHIWNPGITSSASHP